VNKSLTWKQTLLVAIVCYAIDIPTRGIFPNVVGAVLEIVGLACLVLGIIGGIKAAFTKRKR
jgi:hypothetical protein